jgi:hypothetical protein
MEARICLQKGRLPIIEASSVTARQRIVPIRRQYNKWVNNQTLEDYALRFTAKSARKFSSRAISQTAIGAISFPGAGSDRRSDHALARHGERLSGDLSSVALSF